MKFLHDSRATQGSYGDLPRHLAPLCIPGVRPAQIASGQIRGRAKRSSGRVERRLGIAEEERQRNAARSDQAQT